MKSDYGVKCRNELVTLKLLNSCLFIYLINILFMPHCFSRAKESVTKNRRKKFLNAKCSDKGHVLTKIVYFSRCVKGEGEIEKLQTKVVELRRKLDDTTAAMQELGRENQSLQVG